VIDEGGEQRRTEAVPGADRVLDGDRDSCDLCLPVGGGCDRAGRAQRECDEARA
jgi:hypothetical protein